MRGSEANRAFCGAYLRTMDPERAAEESGQADGYAALGQRQVQNQLERMRRNAAGQLRREDVIRRLAQLAFGRVNDAVAFARNPQGVDPEDLDLSAVAELRVTDKGGVEVKLADRVRALESLYNLLDTGGEEAQALYSALESAGRELGEEWDNG